MRHCWKPFEVELLKKIYPETQNKKIAALFGLNLMQITNKASALGLKKSEAYMQSVESGRIMKGVRVSEATQFKKGLTPFNKGKKQTDFMTVEGIERTKKTRFKKGNIPSNFKPIGYERITKDGYVEVKVRNSEVDSKNKNFVLKHRLVWEQNNGPIPCGYIVTFKACADRLNFTIDDLELISRKKNMLINSFCDDAIVKRFLGIKEPKEVEEIKQNASGLIAMKRNSIKLNQKIKENG